MKEIFLTWIVAPIVLTGVLIVAFITLPFWISDFHRPLTEEEERNFAYYI